MVFVRVIRRLAPENIHANRTFFDLIGFAVQSLFDDILQKLSGSSALPEPWVSQNQFQLLTRGTRNLLNVRILGHLRLRSEQWLSIPLKLQNL